jgi:hypothetical protein
MPSFLKYSAISVSSLIPAASLEKVVTNWFLCHAIFYLGSLIFKKHPTTKTVVALILTSIVVGIIQIVLIKYIWTGIDYISEDVINMNGLNLALNLENSPLIKNLIYLFYAISLLFFWIVSYFKLKEKQV